MSAASPRGLPAGEYAALLTPIRMQELGWTRMTRDALAYVRGVSGIQTQDCDAGWMASRVDEHRTSTGRESSRFSRLTLTSREVIANLAI